ncbi:D-galactarate dehydratase [Rhodobacter sp. NTK016B]|uniref:D-galactarate dehydratase n=1 Tax=Rhodobacter sp. NTK016B TaxID=2759676 RepID=UPI001A90738C|nr:D-galactarate dehydratase [Rhodobacter sp. NTK016B]MBN8293911.1 D-galactarate dehydratase [Rhodobacter sp. NTK016B]
MRFIPLALALAPLLAACSSLPFGGGDRTDVAVTESPGSEVMRPQGRPGIQGAEPGLAPGMGEDGRVAAPPEPGADGLLGETLAGIGATGGPGNWVETGLVTATQPGRVETQSGATLDVELRPSGAAPSAGSTISVPAMQALGLPLGQLATLRVYAD